MNPIRIPKPKPAVPVTTFAPPKPPVAPTPIATGLPPPPVHVPPPDLEVKAPEGYDETIEMALKSRKGRLDFAQFWATMAQADATNRIADRLEEFLQILSPAEVELPDGETDEVPAEISSTIADGVRMAAHMLKDDLLTLVPAAAKGQFAELVKSRMGEVFAEMKNGDKPGSIFSQAIKSE